MIVTKDFVYIHLAKTGGTFVTEMLASLYRAPLPPAAERALRSTIKGTWPPVYDPFSGPYLRALGHLDIRKHAACNEIPRPFRDRPVLSTVRNPYDRYVSIFEFGWWRRGDRKVQGQDRIRQDFSGFPDLDFAEFVAASSSLGAFGRGFGYEEFSGVGLQTREFIWHFCRDPHKTMNCVVSNPAAAGAAAVRDDLHDITFLRTEQLNADLAAFLQTLGMAPEEVEGVLRAAKIFPPEGGRNEEQRWESYYTPELKDRVRRQDAVLFELFPSYDI